MPIVRSIRYFSIGFALFMSVGFLGSSFVKVEAQDIQAEVQNIPPEIVAGTEKVCENSGSIANSNIAISSCGNASSVTLNAGGVTSLSFFAKARDANGNADIPSGSFSGAFYHEGNADTADEACTANKNNCYQLSCSKAVDIASGGGTDAWIRCDFELSYFADHSEGLDTWVGHITVHDEALIGANNAGAYETEVAKLVSGTFPVVDFGDVVQGVTTESDDNLAIQHQNNGNVLIDYLVNLDDADTNSALDCAAGELAGGMIKFDIFDSDYATADYTLVAEPSNVEMNINVFQRSDDAGPVVDDDTGDIQRSYWNVSVPFSGPEGYCDEELNVTVFEGP